MSRSYVVWLFLLLAPLVRTSAADDHKAAVQGALDRGLLFLGNDALAWKSEHNCVSCHHAGLVLWAMREAKARGTTVDEPLMVELTKWIVTTGGNGTTGVPRPESAPKAFNEKAVSFALALGAVPQPDEEVQAGLKRMLETIKTDQIENGSWVSWPETRPPLFGNSDDRATAAATLALLPAAAAGEPAALAARDKGVQWLTSTKSDDDPQSIAFRLVLWSRLNRPAEMEPLVQRIRERQNSDGGWSQTAEMASDAWATGQALYALTHGGVKAEDQAIVRGQAFLVQSQRTDGSWPMTSRPTKPGGAGSTSLIPIVGGGSSWAVIGLARSK